MDDYMPLVGFHFEVSIGDDSSEASFQEVSGISRTLETEKITEGGINRFVHKVPGRMTYSDLVLKRGLMSSSSNLAKWCQEVMNADLSVRVRPKQLTVSLLDEENSPIMMWRFANAYPIKWEISSLDAKKSEIVLESITFSYNYYEQVDL